MILCIEWRLRRGTFKKEAGQHGEKTTTRKREKTNGLRMERGIGVSEREQRRGYGQTEPVRENTVGVEHV